MRTHWLRAHDGGLLNAAFVARIIIRQQPSALPSTRFQVVAVMGGADDSAQTLLFNGTLQECARELGDLFEALEETSD